MKIYGTWHQSETHKEFLQALLPEITILSNKTKKMSVGIEVAKSIASKTPFWGKIILGLQNYSAEQGIGLDIHYLDTPTGDRIARKTVENTATIGIPYKNRPAWEKGGYLIDNLRTKSMARQIIKIKPDFILCGHVHALLLGRLLHVQPKFVGASKKEVIAFYRAIGKNYDSVRKERIARRRKQRTTISQKQNNIHARKI